MLFLALCLWLDRGAPRTRLTASIVAFGVAALVLALPLGRLVHKAALPDAFTLVPVWRLGSYDAVVWTFVALAVLAFALLPRSALVAIPIALALVFAATSIVVSDFVADEASALEESFFGTAAPNWVDAAAGGSAAYFYDGEPHWNAVWSYVFWNREIRRVYVLEGQRGVPGPLPQTRVDPFPFGELADDAPPDVVGSTAFTFRGDPVASVDQVGLIHRGLVLWRTDPPLRLSTILVGVQGSGDIHGPASMTAYNCSGGTFELTLIAKGSPVTVRLKAASPRSSGRSRRRRSGSRRCPPSETARRLRARRHAVRAGRLDADRVRALAAYCLPLRWSPPTSSARATSVTESRPTSRSPSRTRPRPTPSPSSKSACSSGSSASSCGTSARSSMQSRTVRSSHSRSRHLRDRGGRAAARRRGRPRRPDTSCGGASRRRESISSPIVCPGRTVTGSRIIRSRTRRPPRASRTARYRASLVAAPSRNQPMKASQRPLVASAQKKSATPPAMKR